ncbi:shikimate dehydrogenase [Arthrobacter sp. EH-1B-1]|uniref:Shikimate dehydrogenase n=1 Tax=Arthrobacter vasquezii TaxID=2977629 RepID=A0ABT6CU80_9MICC|nr:shikimate dehydrogenase [Arthrobacter vasquezii]MDF9277611.1 shikimate dehydrogenase [Arthrobacter vasquezii]
MTSQPGKPRLLIIGSDASHAMSPALWSPVLTELETGWTYEPLDVPADSDMRPLRQHLLDTSVIAANVTMPHKQWAAQTADAASESVKRSGASNLLIPLQGQLQAHNTDIDAFIALTPKMRQQHTLILGAGGAARASIAALTGLTEQLTLTDLDPQVADRLARHATSLGIPTQAIPWNDIPRITPEVSMIINATPIGKLQTDPPAWGDAEISPGTFIYDYVYADHETTTIVAARENALPYRDGWDHLLGQAVAMIPLLGLQPHATNLLQTTLTTIRSKKP